MTIEIRVKTLDSANHVFNVEEEITVKGFKEIIAPTVSIPVDQQRLIFRGRVLQDDKPLKEFQLDGNTVHLVQKPSNSTSNEVPPPPNQSQRNPNAIIMGTIGFPTLEFQGEARDPNEPQSQRPGLRRNSAAVRLGIGNGMLDRASSLLTTLEEDVPSPEELPPTSGAALGGPIQVVGVPVEGQRLIGAQATLEIEGEGGGGGLAPSMSTSPMEVDLDDQNSFSRMISQVANAASSAALMNAWRAQSATTTAGIGGDPTSTTSSSGEGGPRAGVAPVIVPEDPNSSVRGSQQARRTRPYEPRLRELGTALQDLLAFHERLNPYMKHLQGILRENRNYEQEGETQSVQYIFNTISAIMHLLGHSYHAFSDLVTDFTTNADNRRLRASTSILVEQSTVLRATIPFPVIGRGPNGPNTTTTTANVNSAQSTTSNPTLNTVVPPSTNTINASQQGNGQQESSNEAGFSINFGGNVNDIRSFFGGFGAGGGGDSGLAAAIIGVGGPQVQVRMPPTSQNPTDQSTSSAGINAQNSGGFGPPRSNNNGGGNTSRLAALTSFDPLLGCHSHHGGGGRARGVTRPVNFRDFLNLERVENVDGGSGDFFENLIDLLRCSSLIDSLHPTLKDYFANYLLRGRDINNISHIKTCARSLIKPLLQFILSFTNSIQDRDATVNYEATFSTLLVKLFSDVIRLTFECDANRSYRLSFIRLGEEFIARLFGIFKSCFERVPNLPQLFSKALIDKHFGGMSILFRSYACSQLTRYFQNLLISSTESSSPPQGITFQESPTLPQSSPQLPASSRSTAPPQQPSTTTGIARAPSTNSMDLDVDDVLEHVAPPPPRTDGPSSSNAMHNMPDVLINSLPEDWRASIRHDMIRQIGLPDQPPFSPGYNNLFPRN